MCLMPRAHRQTHPLNSSHSTLLYMTKRLWTYYVYCKFCSLNGTTLTSPTQRRVQTFLCTSLRPLPHSLHNTLSPRPIITSTLYLVLPSVLGQARARARAWWLRAAMLCPRGLGTEQWRVLLSWKSTSTREASMSSWQWTTPTKLQTCGRR